MMKEPPKGITLCVLSVVVMPNGEVISGGKSLGWLVDFQKYLTPLSNAEGRPLSNSAARAIAAIEKVNV